MIFVTFLLGSIVFTGLNIIEHLTEFHPSLMTCDMRQWRFETVVSRVIFVSQSNYTKHDAPPGPTYFFLDKKPITTEKAHVPFAILPFRTSDHPSQFHNWYEVFGFTLIILPFESNLSAKGRKEISF